MHTRGDDMKWPLKIRSLLVFFLHIRAIRWTPSRGQQPSNKWPQNRWSAQSTESILLGQDSNLKKSWLCTKCASRVLCCSGIAGWAKQHDTQHLPTFKTPVADRPKRSNFRGVISFLRGWLSVPWLRKTPPTLFEASTMLCFHDKALRHTWVVLRRHAMRTRKNISPEVVGCIYAPTWGHYRRGHSAQGCILYLRIQRRQGFKTCIGGCSSKPPQWPYRQVSTRNNV